MSPACAPYREALSARADGEAMPVAETALDAHLATCALCTAFAATSAELGRRIRVMPAEDVPNLTAAILGALPTVEHSRRQGRFRDLRVLLGAVGVLQLVLAVPLLLDPSALGTHAVREAGIFELALGVGFLVVARWPSRAAGLLPVAAVVAALVTVASLGDVVAGNATLVQETAHLLEVVGTGLLWALDRWLPRDARSGPALA